jgi:hypothetical protein
MARGRNLLESNMKTINRNWRLLGAQSPTPATSAGALALRPTARDIARAAVREILG